MTLHVIPVPKVARPLAKIDPYRHRAAYVRMLSTLYHAEAAALEGFSLLNDPSFVSECDLFERASKKLVEDEAKHLEDIVDILRMLGADAPVDPTDAEREFWTAWRSGDLFALPFKPAIASLFCLFSEGLGYAVLYHLADCTIDPEIRARLWANVEDEKTHLRLSMTVLKRALERDARGFFTDFSVYLVGYSLVAKRAMREQRERLGDLGLDFDVMFGSSLRFVFELLMAVVEETRTSTPGWTALAAFSRAAQEEPRIVTTLYAMMYLPNPPLVARGVYYWGKLGQRRALREARTAEARMTA